MKIKFFIVASVLLMLAFVLVLGTAVAQPTSPCDPAFVARSGKVIHVTPTGVDDTANIQCAFDWANDLGPGMTVRLQPGTFHTAQIFVNDFVGSFRGSGADKTLIVNLPNLYVTPVNGGFNLPSADNPQAILFSFINGRFVIADLAIFIDDHDGNMTTGTTIAGDWGSFTYYHFDAAIYITGTQAEAKVTRILVEGEPIENPDYLQFTANDAVIFANIFAPDSPPPISGSVRVTNSTFKSTGAGTSVGNVKDASILVSHNTFEGNYEMFNGQDYVDSEIEIANNYGETMIGIFFDSEPEVTGTKFVVRNNKIAGDYGVIFWDSVTFGAGNTCLIKSNDFREVLYESVVLLGAGTDQCVLKNNRE
jgi:hypothetical protein